MSATERLHVGPVPPARRGLVLMLHGGAERGLEEIDHRNRAYRRTRWMRDAIAGRLRAEGVAVALLRFRVKGWNENHHDVPPPVADARQAIQHVRAEHDDLPIVLLGHSMGARTAVWAADEPGVLGVVGLAPWLPPDDPVQPLSGKHLVAAHGSRDRITNAGATARYVQRAQDVAASARFVDMGPVGHYMFTGVRRWNALAVTATLSLLTDGGGHHVSGVKPSGSTMRSIGESTSPTGSTPCPPRSRRPA